MNEVKNHWKKWMYWFILGVAIIIVYKALDNFTNIMGIIGNFFNIISPFLAGVFIAYLLYIPCEKIEESYKKSKFKIILKKARGLSILTVYIILILVLVILINYILPVVFESIVDFISNIGGYYEKAINKYNEISANSIFKQEIVNELISNIQNIDIKQYLNVDKILEYVLKAISAVTSIVNIFVAAIVSVYVLAQRTRIITFFKRFAAAVFKENTYKNIDKYFNNSNEIFFKFIASQFLDAVIVGILVSIAMSIMGVKYAPLLGFFIGLFNMIPYVGAIIAVGISAIITLITGGLSQAVWMLIVVIIIQQIDANIITPRIIGQSLKISPLLVMFSIMIGRAYFGVLGMFLAVPAIAIIKILVEDFINVRLAEKQKKQNLNE